MIILYINYPQCSALVTFSLSLLSSVAVMFLFLALLPYWVLQLGTRTLAYTLWACCSASVSVLALQQLRCYACIYAAEFQIHCILREMADQGRLARAVRTPANNLGTRCTCSTLN